MKRYVREFANDKIGKLKRINTPAAKALITKCKNAVKACEKGLITDCEACWLIAKPEDKSEYAVEVYDQHDKFVRQIEVLNSYDDAEKFLRHCGDELSETEHLGILAIHYDTEGNEAGTERVF